MDPFTIAMIMMLSGNVMQQSAVRDQEQAAASANNWAARSNTDLHNKRVDELLDSINKTSTADQQRTRREDAQSASQARLSKLMDDSGETNMAFAGDISDDALRSEAAGVAARSELGHGIAKTFGKLSGIKAAENDLFRTNTDFNTRQKRHSLSAQAIERALRRKLHNASKKGGNKAMMGQMLQGAGTAMMGANAFAGGAGAGAGAGDIWASEQAFAPGVALA